jgi:diacylglycerol O-acyltransferase / wax synthase
VIVVERLTAEDRLMLWSDGSWPQDIGALAILDGRTLLEPDGRLRIETVRAAIASRLHQLPRFRQVLYEPRRGLGWPLWIDAPAFDLRNHVQVAQIPAPGDETQLLLTVEQIRRRRLDRSQPLWEIWFLPGLPEARVGMFVRQHHVIADGVALVAGLGPLLDTVADVTTAPAPPWTPAPRPAGHQLLADNLRRRVDGLGRALTAIAHPVASVRRIRDGWPAMREILAAKPGPRTSLDKLVGPHRTLVLVRSDLGVISQIAHDHRATVNDVLLAVTAGGLRGLLDGRGELIEGLTVPIYVPISLRRDRARPGGGNLISQMVVPLPLGSIDAGCRLDRIASETVSRKAGRRPSLGTVFRSKAVTLVMLKFIARQRVNVESADIPGPSVSLYFSGARMLEVFPLLNLVGNVSLGVGGLSYAGQFNIMAVGDADANPDIENFAIGARNEPGALCFARRCAGRPDPPGA